MRRQQTRPDRSRTPSPVLGTAAVSRILGVPAARVRAIVRAGVCRPARRGRVWQFSFQDLVLLRAAHGLLQRRVPAQRVRRALTELARQLPPGRPLSGVRIYADGAHVVARAGRAVWRPESGQTVFAFAIDELARRARHVLPVPAPAHGRRAPGAPPKAADGAWAWFEHGLAREEADDRSGARAAYEHAIEADPDLADAYVNLGRLVHEAGDLRTALRLYACALERAPIDPVVHYNLALALEDAQRFTEAVAHYEHALRCDPFFADAHFNLSRLLDRLGHRKRALRHLLAYQRLTKGRSS